MTDTEAMVAIHHILDGRSWSADDLESISEVINKTGRTIRPPANEIESAKLWDEDGICLTCGDLRSRCTGDVDDDEEDDECRCVPTLNEPHPFCPQHGDGT